MILPDGTDYPGDYTPEIRRTRAGVTYVIDGQERSLQRLSRPDGTTRAVIPYEDHPVTRAHAALGRCADMRLREHREIYLAWIAIALPADDHDVIASVAPRITAAIQEQNRMEDLERLLARLDAAEHRQDTLESEINDDARASGDAAARAGHGLLTTDVPRE